MLFALYNWSNFIAWLPLLPEIFRKECIITVCFPAHDIINSEINSGFLIELFLTWAQKSVEKFEFLKNKKSF